MSETATVKIGVDVHEIEARPITLLFGLCHNSAGPKQEYPGRIRLDPDQTRYHGERVVKLHADFDTVWRLFFASCSPPIPLKQYDSQQPLPSYSMEARKASGDALVHLVGLIDFSLKLIDLGKPFVWVHPESFMHPGWAVALGDLAIEMSRRGGDDGPTQTAVAEPPKGDAT